MEFKYHRWYIMEGFRSRSLAPLAPINVRLNYIRIMETITYLMIFFKTNLAIIIEQNTLFVVRCESRYQMFHLVKRMNFWQNHLLSIYCLRILSCKHNIKKLVLQVYILILKYSAYFLAHKVPRNANICSNDFIHQLKQYLDA